MFSLLSFWRIISGIKIRIFVNPKKDLRLQVGISDFISKNNNSSLIFEEFKNENGIIFFGDRLTLMKMLGYKEMKGFNKVIDWTIKACITLNISHFDNFKEERCYINVNEEKDFKLSRFACYLTVMNADPKKEQIILVKT